MSHDKKSEITLHENTFELMPESLHYSEGLEDKSKPTIEFSLELSEENLSDLKTICMTKYNTIDSDHVLINGSISYSSFKSDCCEVVSITIKNGLINYCFEYTP